MHLLKSPEDTCILFQLQIETPAAIFRCVFLISVFRFRRKTQLFFLRFIFIILPLTFSSAFCNSETIRSILITFTGLIQH